VAIMLPLTTPPEIGLIFSSMKKTLPENEWLILRDQVRKQIDSYRQTIGSPVSLTADGQIRLSEYAMIPERPYIIEYAETVYEFVRKSDGSIVISEIQIG
jgi:hypothetical protein